MIIKHTDYKKGIVKVKIEDNEDLWTLSKIITPSDRVSSNTTRVIKKQDREGIRKKVFIKVLVEKVEFREAAFVLKILGKIIEGPDDVPSGSYHSFNLEPNVQITIEKDSWSSYDKKSLKSSQHKPAKILVTILDSKEATHALINNGSRELFSHHARLPRKDDPKHSKMVNDYYLELIKQIKGLMKNHKIDQLVIAGPGFAPEGLIKVAETKGLKPFKAHTNHIGMTGVKELIKNGQLDNLLKENEVSEETKLVEEFFTQVNKDKLIKYGFNSVKSAIENGAVKTLLISEGVIVDFRERKRFKEIDNIINKAEQMKTKIEFIGIKHEAGKQFYRFGGVGAMLRYEV